MKRTSAQLLAKYRTKRDFSSTPEPTGDGDETARRAHLRYCIQKHLASHLHYDFRLEHNGVLVSWAIPKGPSLNPRDKRLAVQVEAHPLDYGHFEGVIPKGYGAGIVMLWDEGTWEAESADIDHALAKGELKFSLHGAKLKGSWVLVRIGGAESRNWLLIKHTDQWSGNVDVTTTFPLSVRSSHDFAEILAAGKPDIWQSHLPAQSGAAGAMLREVIHQAAELKARRKRTHSPNAAHRSRSAKANHVRVSAARRKHSDTDGRSK